MLLDMNMPVMNGLAFLESYTHLPLAQQQATVIFLLTTSLHERDMARVQQLPIVGSLAKTLTKGKLLDIVQVHFPQAVPPTAPDPR